MLESAEGRLSDPREERTKCRVAREVAAESQHIDEVTDQALGLGSIAIGDRRPDDEIILAAVAVKQRLERREQDHERRGPFAAAEGAERFREVGRQREELDLAADRSDGRPWTIGREFERNRTGETLGPVAQEPLSLLTFERAALPGREIGVLNGQLREWRRRVVAERLVEPRPARSRPRPATSRRC